jgi:hypothetical protein
MTRSGERRNCIPSPPHAQALALEGGLEGRGLFAFRRCFVADLPQDWRFATGCPVDHRKVPRTPKFRLAEFTNDRGDAKFREAAGRERGDLHFNARGRD